MTSQSIFFMHCYSKEITIHILSFGSVYFSMPFQIDVLINNGGRSQRSLCMETSIDVYQALMELNFLGTVSITKEVLPHMIQQGTGSIVTVSSIAGLAGVPLSTGYSASKHALQVKGTQRETTKVPLVFVFFNVCSLIKYLQWSSSGLSRLLLDFLKLVLYVK